MGGTDVGLSASYSSSATSGAHIGHYERGGEFIVGGKKPANPWLLPVVIVGLVLVAVVFLLRKF